MIRLPANRNNKNAGKFSIYVAKIETTFQQIFNGILANHDHAVIVSLYSSGAIPYEAIQNTPHGITGPEISLNPDFLASPDHQFIRTRRAKISVLTNSLSVNYFQKKAPLPPNLFKILN